LQEQFGLTIDDVRSHIAGLYRAGVCLVSGSDAGVSVAKRHGVLREAVIDLAESSIPADEALASATSRAADAIGLGDPLTDPTALRNVRTVVARRRVAVTT
jgi:imidazolonepropionase-like amidohydrolase